MPHQKSRTGHREGAESVDHPPLKVDGHVDGGGACAERKGLRQNAGHQKVHVGGLPRIDCPAENIAEEQQEHDRHDCNRQELIQVPDDVPDAAQGKHPRVVEPPENAGELPLLQLDLRNRNVDRFRCS